MPEYCDPHTPHSSFLSCRMPASPRQHHYVPEGYLVGFTSGMTPDTFLHVMDLKRGRQFRVIPRNAGKERDFYRIQRSDGGDEQIIEKWLGTTIDIGSNILRYIDQELRLPSGAELQSLMTFISASVLRAPMFRHRIDSIVDINIRDILTHLSDDDDAFRRFVGTMPPGLLGDIDEVALLRKYVSDPNMRLSFEQTYHIRQMLDMIPALASTLMQRSWHVIQCTDQSFNFVCSDNPVSLLRTEPSEELLGTAFGSRHTILFFPVTKRTALVGTYGDERYTTKENKNRCAIVNSHTTMNATRFVYSPEAEIEWMDDNEVVCGTTDLLERTKNARCQ